MNLKERMQHQNRNNSEILNNSNFDFARGSRQDQVYERSRRQCEEELYKRKSQLEQDKNLLFKTKEKEANFALQKFLTDFQELRKQILSQVDTSLVEIRNRFVNQIKERLAVETNEEIRIRKQIDQLMNFINNHLVGLKKDHYREYISKVVVTDFDNPKEQVKKQVRNVKYAMPYTTIDQKYYSCLRNDIQRIIFVQFGNKFEGNKSQMEVASRPPSYPRSENSDVNLHENRDRLKMGL